MSEWYDGSRGRKDFKHETDSTHHWNFKDGGKESQAKEYGQYLEAWNSPHLMDSKGMGTSALQTQGTEFCLQPEWAREQIPPRASRKECFLTDTEFTPGRLISDFWPQNYEIILIYLCCFKLLNLWYLVMETIVN